MLSLLELIMAEMKHRKILTKYQRKREILNSKNQELRKSAPASSFDSINVSHRQILLTRGDH